MCYTRLWRYCSEDAQSITAYFVEAWAEAEIESYWIEREAQRVFGSKKKKY